MDYIKMIFFLGFDSGRAGKRRYCKYKNKTHRKAYLTGYELGKFVRLIPKHPKLLVRV